MKSLSETLASIKTWAVMEGEPSEVVKVLWPAICEVDGCEVRLSPPVVRHHVLRRAACEYPPPRLHVITEADADSAAFILRCGHRLLAIVRPGPEAESLKEALRKEFPT